MATPPAPTTAKSDCLTANEVIQLYGDKLNEFEKAEIHEYAEVWFLGLEAEKINATSAKDYDDENGTYVKVNKDTLRIDTKWWTCWARVVLDRSCGALITRGRSMWL